MQRVLEGGARYAVEQGHGVARDLTVRGPRALAGADPAAVSDRALERGLGQVGSLGSGNHFLEVQVVDQVYDAAAERVGPAAGRVCVMIHCGSRGLGHQVCTDHVRGMEQAMGRYGIAVPDRQLACAPVRSPEGQAYLAAMAAAANYGRANRQLLTEAARRVFEPDRAPLDLVYDVSHNLAKIETHDVDGHARPVRAPQGRDPVVAARTIPTCPPTCAAVGQPVLIPGTMGTASYVLAGVPDNPAFSSTAHGAGRVQSRHQAARNTSGKALRSQLEARGILVRGSRRRGLAEEKPEAYKDIDAVADTSERAGLARRWPGWSPWAW